MGKSAHIWPEALVNFWRFIRLSGTLAFQRWITFAFRISDYHQESMTERGIHSPYNHDWILFFWSPNVQKKTRWIFLAQQCIAAQRCSGGWFEEVGDLAKWGLPCPPSADWAPDLGMTLSRLHQCVRHTNQARQNKIHLWPQSPCQGWPMVTV